MFHQREVMILVCSAYSYNWDYWDKDDRYVYNSLYVLPYWFPAGVYPFICPPAIYTVPLSLHSHQHYSAKINFIFAIVAIWGSFRNYRCFSLSNFLLGFSPFSLMIPMSLLHCRHELFTVTFVVNISKETTPSASSLSLDAGPRMPQSQLAWDAPWTSWRAFQAICSQLWCSHVRIKVAHSSLPLPPYVHAPNLPGRSAAGGGLPGKSWHPGREKMATEILFLRMYPFVLKKVMHLGFFLEIGAPECTSSLSWGSISRLGERSRRTVSCARAMVLCGKDVWFKYQCVTYLLCPCGQVISPAFLPFLQLASVPGASAVGCGHCALTLPFIGGLMTSPTPSPLRCQKRQALQLFIYLSWKWHCWSSEHFHSPWWPGVNDLSLDLTSWAISRSEVSYKAWWAKCGCHVLL